MVQYCFICKWKADKEPKRSFHRFPLKESEKQKWLSIIGKSGVNIGKRTSICSIHFEKSCFRYGLVNNREILKPDCVPSLYLPKTTETSKPVMNIPPVLSVPESSLQDCIDENCSEISASTYEELQSNNGSMISTKSMSETVLSRFKEICRCCHSEGSFKSLKESYRFRGKIEMYSDMLTETFGLKLNPETLEVGCNICDDCVVRLRDSTRFKNQVEACEEMFNQIYAQYYKNIKVEVDDDSDFEVKNEVEAANEVELNEVNYSSDVSIKHEFVNDDSCGDIDIVKHEVSYSVDDENVWNVGNGDHFEKDKADDGIASPGTSTMKKSHDGIVFEKCVNHEMCVTTYAKEDFISFDTKSTCNESNSAGPSKDSQVFGCEVGSIQKRANSADSTSHWRDKEKGFIGSRKKPPKTAAQRMREYRQRKKIAREKQLKRSYRDLDTAASTSSSRS